MIQLRNLRKKYDEFYAVTDNKFKKKILKKSKKRKSISYKRNRSWSYFLFWR